MLFVAYLRWWYGVGWANAIRQSKHYLKNLSQDFSVLTLLRTLFAPWKQIDAYGGANQSLSDRFRHFLDKTVSRFVGFLARSVTLVAAGVSFTFLLLARAIWILLWPLLPLLAPALVLYGFGAF